MDKIRWQHNEDGTAYGYTESKAQHKYFVGYEQRGKRMIADVRPNPRTNLMWEGVDIPIDSIEHGITLCEAWEATGVYD